MNRRLAARCLAELGNLTRLDIYRLLVRASFAGYLADWLIDAMVEHGEGVA